VKVRTRKLAVFVTCLGIAAAFPVLSSADKGGVPHSNKPCKTKKAKKKPKKPAPNNKGKKCGFNRGTTSTTSSVAGPTVPTGTETETTTTTGTT
jgi:hypothetical protein